MEYTKDIILDLKGKKQIGALKFKNWTGNLGKRVKNNKIITMSLFLLSTLVVIDLILVNSFLQVFMNLH